MLWVHLFKNLSWLECYESILPWWCVKHSQCVKHLNIEQPVCLGLGGHDCLTHNCRERIHGTLCWAGQSGWCVWCRWPSKSKDNLQMAKDMYVVKNVERKWFFGTFRKARAFYTTLRRRENETCAINFWLVELLLILLIMYVWLCPHIIQNIFSNSHSTWLNSHIFLFLH